MGHLKEATIDRPQALMALSQDPATVTKIDEPGRGKWPKRPPDSCNKGYTSGFVATIRLDRTSLAPIRGRNWRECPGCYHDRVIRHSKQVLHEGTFYPLHLMEVPDKAAYNRLIDKWRQWRARNGNDVAYRAYPQDDDRYLIIHNQDQEAGEPISDNRGRLYRLLKTYLNTPEDLRVSSSEGWGGPFQGAKGDGRAKQAAKEGLEPDPYIQLWSDSKITKAAKALDIDLGKTWRGGCDIDAIDAYNRMANAGIAFYVKGGKSAWDVFLSLLLDDDGACHDLGTGKDKDHLSLMRDNGQRGEESGPARTVQPLLLPGRSGEEMRYAT